jgi:DNA-binding CsgD family transcriptional regulator
MKAEKKQQWLAGVGILLVMCSIGFSFDGESSLWFWQRYPFIPVLLLVLAFGVLRYWLRLEIDKQRQKIVAEYFKVSVNDKQDEFRSLLSRRETEVLELIHEGLSNKEIAARLHVSLATVKTHINNIYKLLEVSNRREAIEKTGI